MARKRKVTTVESCFIDLEMLGDGRLQFTVHDQGSDRTIQIHTPVFALYSLATKSHKILKEERDNLSLIESALKGNY